MKSSRTETRSISPMGAIKKPQQLVETTHHFKGVCEEAQQKLADLTGPTGLLQQMPAVINEWQSLLKLKEVYEIKFFMLALESQRLKLVVSDLRALCEDLTLKNEDLKFSSKKQQEEHIKKLQLEFERRLEAIRSEHFQEVHGWKQNCEHLQLQNSSLSANLESFKGVIQSDKERINDLELKLDHQKRRLQQEESEFNFKLQQMRAECNNQIREFEQRLASDVSNQQQILLEQAKHKEDAWSKERSQLTDLVKRSEVELVQFRNLANENNMRMSGLQHELDLAKSKLKNRDEELVGQTNRQKAELVTLQAMYDDLQSKFYNERACRDNEKRDKEREAQELRANIDQMKVKHQEMQSRVAKLQDDLSTEKQQAQAKTANVENEKQEEIFRIKQSYQKIEETWRQERTVFESEISNLISTHFGQKQLLQAELDQLRTNHEALNAEFENWKREYKSLDDLRAQKQAEIEKYSAKYKDYLRPEEARQLKDDYERLRVQVKHYEGENQSLNDNSDQLRKVIQNLEFDLVAKSKKAEQADKLAQEKKRELEELETRYHSQQEQMRLLGQTRDQFEGQFVTLKQKLADLDTDYKKACSERDGAKRSFEQLNAQFNEFREDINRRMGSEETEGMKRQTTHTSTYTMVRQSAKLAQSGYMSGNPPNS